MIKWATDDLENQLFKSICGWNFLKIEAFTEFYLIGQDWLQI